MKEYYKEKLVEYKNHFFTIGEYELATELRNLEILVERNLKIYVMHFLSFLNFF
jgi:hypothetical protein